MLMMGIPYDASLKVRPLTGIYLPWDPALRQPAGQHPGVAPGFSWVLVVMDKVISTLVLYLQTHTHTYVSICMQSMLLVRVSFCVYGRRTFNRLGYTGSHFVNIYL